MNPVQRYDITGDDGVLDDDHPGRVVTEHLGPVDLPQAWISPEYQFAGVKEVLYVKKIRNCDLG